MRTPDWRKVAFVDGILQESVPNEDRLVCWLPEERQQGCRCWERVATVAGAKIQIEQGIGAIAATSVRARRLGFLDRVRRRMRPGSAAQAWTLPNGQSLEQLGARRMDLVLAWAEDEVTPLDDVRIKARWPQSHGSQKIGGNLYLVRGVEPAVDPGDPSARSPQPAAAPESPVQLAEQMLTAARRSQDNRKIASALTDLGVVLTRQGYAQKAVPLLEEALALVRQLGDRSLESDVLNNLGMAVLMARQLQRALELFQQGLENARSARDRFAEKMALGYLGMAYSAMRDVGQAFAMFGQALAIAREVGDRQQQVDLLWQLGIVHAEAGQRDQAVARSEEALELFRQMGHPQADYLEAQLQKYRAGEIGSPWEGPGSPGAGSSPFFGGQIVTSGWTEQGIVPGQTQAASGPGVLRMAFSFIKSMAQFAGAGFKPTSNEVYQKRLQTCGPCEHHTGLRCKVCGCFTSVKARMAIERCPIGKWPV